MYVEVHLTEQLEPVVKVTDSKATVLIQDHGVNATVAIIGESREALRDALRQAAEELDNLDPNRTYQCHQIGPGEAECELETDHPGAHQLRRWGPQGALGTMYWEYDEETEELFASWKHERGAFESEEEFAERKARNEKAGV